MMAALAPRGDRLVFPHFTGVLFGVDRAVEGRGLPEAQVHIRGAQIGGAQAQLLLEGRDRAQQAIQGAIAVRQRQGLGRRPIPRIGQPVRVAGQLGGGTREPVGGQGEPGRLVGGVTTVLLQLLPPQRPAAQLCPSRAGGVEHPVRLDLLDVLDADIQRELAGRQLEAVGVDHAPETLGQAAQGLRIDLVGTAERRDHTRLRAPSLLMVVMFGELVVDGVRTMWASLSGRS
jgi:hypothetical protein